MSRQAAIVFFACTLAAVAIAFPSSPALAAWPAGGIVVSEAYRLDSALLYGNGPCNLVRAADGSIVLVASPTSPSSYAWNVSRVSANGDTLPGWPRTGTRVWGYLRGYDDHYFGSAITPSGDVFWSFGNATTLTLQKVTNAGTLPTAYTSWSPASPVSSLFGASLAAGAVGDAFVSWRNRVQRVLGTGAVAPGWPAAGFTTATSGIESAAMADGSGGVIVLAGGIGLVPRVTRVDSNAVLHTGWPTGGRALCSAASADRSLLEIRHRLLRTDATHGMALWVDGGTSAIRLQRFSFSGALDPAWGPDGVEIETASPTFGCEMVADGFGGAWIGYEFGDLPVLAHVLSDGSIDAQFSPLDDGAVYRSQYRNAQKLNALAFDAAPDGGVFFAWSDLRQDGFEQVRWRRFAADGSPHPAEPTAGRVVETFPLTPTYTGNTRAIASDGEGGVYVARDLGSPIKLHHEVPFTALGVPPSAPRAGLLLRAPAPNPVRDAITLRFSLPDARPATLTLFDVAGRALRTSQASGAGEHTVRWDDAGALSPGLYLAQLRQGAEQRTARVVVTR